jgi:hypothetical protein
MRHEKTFLPSATQQNHKHNHRVSLLFFQRTQEAMMQASPTGGSHTKQAPQIRDYGWMSSQGG